MRNVIVFGNVPLATWVVKQLLINKHFQLLGVVCDPYEKDAFAHHGSKDSSLYSFCTDKELQILQFGEALEVAMNSKVLGISVRYHRIFKKEYFEKFRPGIINLHGGELPRYRGANIANYAILEEAKKIGGTLHFISKGLDEGDIVERVIFPVQDKMTAFEYFSRTFDALKQAFIRFLSREDVIDDTQHILATPQAEYEKRGEKKGIYYKKGIEDKRVINFEDIKNWDDFYKLARAFTFPGHQGLIVRNGEETVEVKVVKND